MTKFVGDALVRTHSAQSFSKIDQKYEIKKAVSRTKSLNPNQEKSLLQQGQGSIWNRSIKQFENDRQCTYVSPTFACKLWMSLNQKKNSVC